MKKYIKNIYKIVMVAIPFLLLTGCGEDFLTQYPQDKLSAGTFFQTDADYIAAANGVYDAGIKQSNAEFIAMLDMATPFADCNGGRLNVYQMRRTNGVIDINDGYWGSKTFWPVFYNYVWRANSLLDNIDNENSTEVSDYIRNRSEGEALFLRAYAYFNLAQMFGGVPLATTVLPYEELQLPRSTKEEVIAQIIADLTKAVDLLPSVEDYRGSDDLGRVSKGAAQALLGKTYLFSEDWSNAEIWLDKVITSGDYVLEPYYVDMFWPSGENGKESIFEIQYKSNDPGGSDRNRWTQYAGFLAQSNTYWTSGWQYVHPTQYYVDQFETVNGYKVESQYVDREQNPLSTANYLFNYSYSSDDPGFDANDPYVLKDPRLKWTVWYDNTPYIDEDYTSRSATTGSNFDRSYTFATNHGSVKYMTGKVDAQDHSGMNMIVIRYADVLLMAAEAKLEQNNLTGAETLIDQVRARVGMPAISAVEAAQGRTIAGNQTDLRLYMRAERYRELAFEWGHMYYDQIRWKIFDDEMESFWNGSTDGWDNYPAFSWDDKWWLWPIPGDELGRNTALQGNQNPGY